MRILLAIIIAAALGWSGFWWFQASMRDRALTQWLADRQADGWTAEAADISVSGFPNRVDTTVTALSLADPDGGWRWDASALEILSLTYTPHRFIAALPGAQIVTTRTQTVTAQSDNLRGSIAFQPNTRLELDHSTFEIGNMQIVSDLGWEALIGSAVLATRQAAEPFAHDVAFNAQNLALPLDLPAADDVLPRSIQSMALDTTLGFDRPWDRTTVENDTPKLTRVSVRAMDVTWGELQLSGNGELNADSRGFASGRIEIKARNWRRMLDVARASGAVDPVTLSAIEAGLGLMAQLGGDRNTLTVPLDFADGRMRLGPIPLGEAPRFLIPG